MGVRQEVKLLTRDRAGRDVTVVQSATPLPVFLEAKTVEGNYVLIPQTQEVKTHTDVTVRCDGQGCTVELKWNQELTDEGVFDFPKEAYRLLTLELFDGSKKVFCGVKCASAFLSTHSPLVSPRENSEKIINIAEHRSK